jgi:hypothetical protein
MAAWVAYKVYQDIVYEPEKQTHIQLTEPSDTSFKVMQYNILADCYTDASHSSNLN